MKGLSVAQKNELLFQNGVNFNDLPLWQKRGSGLYWEEYERPAENPVTGEKVVARRRRVRRDLELPMKDDYSAFLHKLLPVEGVNARDAMKCDMQDRVHHHPNLIYSLGTQVVTLVEILGQSGKVLHPRGSVGVVVRSPVDLDHPYRVRFADGIEESLNRDQVTMLARYKESEIGDTGITAIRCNLYERVIYRCVIGSQAYGLAGEGSDIDRRGIYLPPADLHWSLYGVPDQLENDDTQEAYWEIQKFLVLALKANPNVLECLYTPTGREGDSAGRETAGDAVVISSPAWCTRRTTATSCRSSRRCRPTCATRAR